MAIFSSHLFSILVSSALLLTGIAIGRSAEASSEDACYGIAIEIQTEIEKSLIKSQQSGNQGAKALAAKIRKRHRLATVPPVTLVNERVSEVPSVVFHRPTDYACALAISQEVRKHSALAVVPQPAAKTDRINTGMISVWWPADSATVIANHNEK